MAEGRSMVASQPSRFLLSCLNLSIKRMKPNMFMHCIRHFCIPTKNRIDIQSQKMRHPCTQVLWQNDIDILFNLWVGCPKNTAAPELPSLLYRTFGHSGQCHHLQLRGDCDGDTASCSFDARLISFPGHTAQAVASPSPGGC